MLTLIDGYLHPLGIGDSSNAAAWQIACDDVGKATGRLLDPSDVAACRMRTVMRLCGCSSEDLARAKTDDAVYLSLLSKYVEKFDTLGD